MKLQSRFVSLVKPRAQDEDLARRELVLNTILVGFTAIASLFTFGAVVERLISESPGLQLTLGAISAVTLLILWIISRAGYATLSGWLMVLFFIALGAYEGVVGDILGEIQMLFLLMSVVLGSVLLRARDTFTVATVSLIVNIVVDVLLQTPNLVPRAYTLAGILYSTALLVWLSSRQVDQAFDRVRGTAQELQDANLRLAENARTLQQSQQQLAHRAAYLEASAAVARETASVLDVQPLIERVVTLISERFGFYHTGLFLLDPSRTWAVLRAASSEAGRDMLMREVRVPLSDAATGRHSDARWHADTHNIVSDVATQGTYRIVQHMDRRHLVGTVESRGDAENSPRRSDARPHSDAPFSDTRSQIALPLRARGQVLGVLDVHSTQADAFAEEDITAFQALADQVALAIGNARLFEEVQERAAAERRALGQMTREAWQELLRAEPDLGFVKDQEVVLPIGDAWETEMRLAAKSGRITLGGAEGMALAVPIMAGDQVVAVLDAELAEAGQEWNAEQIALMENLADQLGQALDRARLYRQTRLSAARDRAVAQVAARVRQELYVSDVLRTAVDEVQQVLGLEKISIQMMRPSEEASPRTLVASPPDVAPSPDSGDATIGGADAPSE